jgi:anti-sigma B factor antagonist
VSVAGKESVVLPPKHTHYGWLEVHEVGEATVVTLTRRHLMQAEPIGIIGGILFNLADNLGSRSLVVSFSQVAYLSSAMLTKLVLLHQKIYAAGGRLGLCGVHPDVQQAFVATGLDKLFNIYRDEQEALRALASADQ